LIIAHPLVKKSCNLLTVSSYPIVDVLISGQVE